MDGKHIFRARACDQTNAFPEAVDMQRGLRRKGVGQGKRLTFIGWSGMGPVRRGREQAVRAGADEDRSEFAPHGGAMTRR
jgi:hypothetical protein